MKQPNDPQLGDGKWIRFGDTYVHESEIIATALRQMTYKEYLGTGHWHEIRERTLKLQGYRCHLCMKGGLLHVHHVSYKNLGCEPPEDVVALCPECHKSWHESLQAQLKAQFAQHFQNDR